MGYIENNLQSGEVIAYRAQIHWAIFISPIVWFLLIFVFSRQIIIDGNKFYVLMFMISIWAFIYLFIKAIVTKISAEYALTNKRLIMKRGIISRKSLELILTKCEGISVDQRILGRLLGFGTIIVTTGGVTNKYAKIANPIEFRNRINEQINILHEKSSLIP